MAVATSTAILIGTAVSAVAGAVVAKEQMDSQKDLANQRIKNENKLEAKRRQSIVADQKAKEVAQQTQARVAAAEGNRLRGLQLDAKGIKRRESPSGSFAAQTEQVLNEK